MVKPAWSVARLAASAGEIHHREIVDTTRTVTLCRVRRAALVLGSTQPDDDVDGDAVAACGLEVTRRRSGGGAVVVEPGAMAWVDVYVPRDDTVWAHDVGQAFWWLGQAWADALAALGVQGTEVHRRRPITTKWSSKICFAGVGAGEVTLRGRKVVGMAQRRTRAGAMFQCAALVRWDARQLLDVLALAESEREEGVAALADAAAGVGPAVSVDELEQSLVSHLP